MKVAVCTRPYRSGVSANVMDMDAFVTDMKGYWPLTTTSGASSTFSRVDNNMQIHLMAAVFLLSSLMIFWGGL